MFHNCVTDIERLSTGKYINQLISRIGYELDHEQYLLVLSSYSVPTMSFIEENNHLIDKKCR